MSTNKQGCPGGPKGLQSSPGPKTGQHLPTHPPTPLETKTPSVPNWRSTLNGLDPIPGITEFLLPIPGCTEFCFQYNCGITVAQYAIASTWSHSSMWIHSERQQTQPHKHNRVNMDSRRMDLSDLKVINLRSQIGNLQYATILRTDTHT